MRSFQNRSVLGMFVSNVRQAQREHKARATRSTRASISSERFLPFGSTIRQKSCKHPALVERWAGVGECTWTQIGDQYVAGGDVQKETSIRTFHCACCGADHGLKP